MNVLGQIFSHSSVINCFSIVVDQWVMQSNSREMPALGGPVLRPNVQRFLFNHLPMITSLVQSMTFVSNYSILMEEPCLSLVQGSDQAITDSPNNSNDFFYNTRRKNVEPVPVMVHVWSHSFQRTIKGQLQQSL